MNTNPFDTKSLETGVIGSIQALEILKLVAGIGEPLVGRLLLYDALAQRFDEIRYKKRR